MTARPLILPVVALCSKSASSGQLSEDANPGFGDWSTLSCSFLLFPVLSDTIPSEAASLVAVFDEACPERSRRVGTTHLDGFWQRSHRTIWRTRSCALTSTILARTCSYQLRNSNDSQPPVTSNLASPQKLDHDCLMQSLSSCRKGPRSLIVQASSTTVSKPISFAPNILRTSYLDSRVYQDLARIEVCKPFDSIDFEV